MSLREHTATTELQQSSLSCFRPLRLLSAHPQDPRMPLMLSPSCLTSAFPSFSVPSATPAGCTIRLQSPPRRLTLTSVEATSQGWPRFVVLPQVAQIPVTLVLHQPNHLLV